MKRRHFITTAFSTTLGVGGLGSKAFGDRFRHPQREEAIAFLEEHFAFDLHSHGGALEGKGIEEMIWAAYVGDAKQKIIFEEMIKSGLRATYMCLTSDWKLMKPGAFGNRKRLFHPGEAWADYQLQINNISNSDFLEIMPIELAMKVSDIERINQNGHLAVFLSTEGSHMIEEDINRLETLYSDGIRRFQPIHYLHSELGDSQTDPPAFNGLSEKGRIAIEQAVELGMMIDVAHASFECTKQIADLVQAPLTLSHSMMLFGELNHPRLISEDHAKLIAETDGIIGTWPISKPSGFENMSHFVEGILRMIDAVGVDHVGWSSDFVGGYGDGDGFFNSYDDFVDLVAELMAQGLTGKDLQKFMGGNTHRLHELIVG